MTSGFFSFGRKRGGVAVGRGSQTSAAQQPAPPSSCGNRHHSRSRTLPPNPVPTRDSRHPVQYAPSD